MYFFNKTDTHTFTRTREGEREREKCESFYRVSVDVCLRISVNLNTFRNTNRKNMCMKQKRKRTTRTERTICRRANCAWHPRYFVVTKRMRTCERLPSHVYITLLFHYTCCAHSRFDIHTCTHTATTNNP